MIACKHPKCTDGVCEERVALLADMFKRNAIVCWCMRCGVWEISREEFLKEFPEHPPVPALVTFTTPDCMRCAHFTAAIPRIRRTALIRAFSY